MRLPNPLAAHPPVGVAVHVWGRYMEYQPLGEGELQVSALCLATRMFDNSESQSAARQEMSRIFDAFTGAGGNFVDASRDDAMAPPYNYSHPIAEIIASEREHLVIASGCRLASHIAGPRGDGSHRKAIVEALDTCLSALHTDYLDLYWVNNWDYFTPAEEVMRALAGALAAGKIRHVGIATSDGWIINLANTIADLHGWPPSIAVKAPYNVVFRDIEQDVSLVAQTFNMPVIATSPLAGGILAGQPPRSFIGQRERMLIAQLETLAGETGFSPAQLALAWLRQRRAGKVIPLLTVDTEAQMRECLDYEACSLSQDQIRRLEPNLQRPSLPPSPSGGGAPLFNNASTRSSLLLRS